MGKTKKALGDIMAKAGHHDTTVHEETAPVVEHKTVKPTSHEEVSTAVDREIHQDHYHRTVQPVEATEMLPEQHKHRVARAINRVFDHRDQHATERAMKAEAAKLRDEKKVEATTHTQSRATVVQGEHVHHHVHETVQPLLEKEVIQPEVIHTAVPVHEVHHNAARMHPTSTKDPVTMDEFKKAGGSLGGISDGRTTEFEGCPRGEGIHESSGAGSSSVKDSSIKDSSRGLGTSCESDKKPSLMDRLNPYKDCR